MRNSKFVHREHVQTSPSNYQIYGSCVRVMHYPDETQSQSDSVPQEEEEKDGGKLCFHSSKAHFYLEVPSSSTLVLGRTGALFGTRTRFSNSSTSTASTGTSTNGRGKRSTACLCL